MSFHGTEMCGREEVEDPWSLDPRRYLYFLRREYAVSRTMVEREVVLAEWISTQHELRASRNGA